MACGKDLLKETAEQSSHSRKGVCSLASERVLPHKLHKTRLCANTTTSCIVKHSINNKTQKQNTFLSASILLPVLKIIKASELATLLY